MHRVAVISLLAFVGRCNAEEPAANRVNDTQNSMDQSCELFAGDFPPPSHDEMTDELADELVTKLVDKAMHPLRNDNLDETTLGKPATTLANAPSMAASRALPPIGQLQTLTQFRAPATGPLLHQPTRTVMPPCQVGRKCGGALKPGHVEKDAPEYPIQLGPATKIPNEQWTIPEDSITTNADGVKVSNHPDYYKKGFYVEINGVRSKLLPRRTMFSGEVGPGDPQDKQWYVVDATDLVVGRVACEIAKILRGKHKVNWAPWADLGDHVIVTNVEKVAFTGNKGNINTGKKYRHHTGYLGGLKETTAGKILEGRFPGRVLAKAVRGMMPKTRLGAKLYKRLYLFAGPNHPYEFRKPMKYHTPAMKSLAGKMPPQKGDPNVKPSTQAVGKSWGGHTAR